MWSINDEQDENSYGSFFEIMNKNYIPQEKLVLFSHRLLFSQKQLKPHSFIQHFDSSSTKINQQQEARRARL